MPPTRRRPATGAGPRPPAGPGQVPRARAVAPGQGARGARGGGGAPGGGGPLGPRRPGPRRPPIRWSTRIAGGIALLVITASGLGHAVVDSLTGAIDRVDAFGGMQGRPQGSKGTNFLLVGTDGRDGLDPTEKQQYHLGGAPCHCTDTIMLVHLSQDRRRASVVSIPRDSYVRLPDVGPAAVLASRGTAGAAPASSGAPAAASPSASASASSSSRGSSPSASAPVGTHPAKINEAYADGGPKLTVQTVERLTGVHIDHYLEVDFTSFMKTVDVIGGVPVCTTEPLTDSYTGLRLPAGTTRLDGGQALQYVRSRHIDGSADLGRMQRQQKFLAQVIHKITSSGTLSDPVELSRVAGTVLGSVRADQGLSATDLIALAQGMKGFSPSSSEFASVPLSDLNYKVPGIGSTVKWDDAKAGALWAAIRADRPLTAPRRPAHPSPGSGTATVDVDPATIRVTLANGTSTNGLAASAQKALRATGFVTPGLPATAAAKVARTEIRYDPRWDRSAKALGSALPTAKLVPVAGQGAVMRVVLGPDYTKVTPVRAASHPVGESAVTGDEVTCP